MVKQWFFTDAAAKKYENKISEYNNILLNFNQLSNIDINTIFWNIESNIYCFTINNVKYDNTSFLTFKCNYNSDKCILKINGDEEIIADIIQLNENVFLYTFKFSTIKKEILTSDNTIKISFNFITAQSTFVTTTDIPIITSTIPTTTDTPTPSPETTYCKPTITPTYIDTTILKCTTTPKILYNYVVVIENIKYTNSNLNSIREAQELIMQQIHKYGIPGNIYNYTITSNLNNVFNYMYNYVNHVESVIIPDLIIYDIDYYYDIMK